jgi:tetratricopeptide (TPR) repeat protein
MNGRLVFTPILALVLTQSAPGQSASQGVDATQVRSANDTFKQGLLQRIARQEEAARQAESAHAGIVELSKIYFQLGLLYQDAAQWPRAEATFQHTISLLRNPPGQAGDLATAISQLGSLYVLMGKLRDSEKEAREAMKLRQEVGDRLSIARSQNDLAIIYIKEQKYAKARDLAQEAEAEFTANGGGSVLDKIIVRSTLSEAICYLKQCSSAIPMLKEALDAANATMHPGDFPIGLANFLLGYAYWKSGNMGMAGEYLERGTTLMNTQLGWGHPVYLKALMCYAQYLRETRQLQTANVIERKIRQAEAVVDVHTIQAAEGMFGFDGLH